MPTNVIPKEQLTAYQRWELAAFEETASGKVEAAEVESSEIEGEVRLPTAKEIEEIHEEARRAGHALGLEEGRKAGHDAGYREGMARAERDVQRLGELIAALEAEAVRADERLAEEVLSVALGVARAMLRVELQVHPERILDAIREALSSLHSLAGHLRIVAHPDDAETVREWLGMEHAHLSSKVIEDAHIEPGGFRIETGQSQIDAELPTRWRQIQELLDVRWDWRIEE